MKKMKVIVPLALLIFIACCKPSAKVATNTPYKPGTSFTPGAPAAPATPAAPVAAKPSMDPTESDVTFAKQKWSDTDLVKLQQGQALYTGNCGKCHELFSPDQFSEKKWEHEVPPMAKKARLDDAQGDLILRFILAKHESMSAKPATK